MKFKKIGQILLERGDINQQQLDEALQAQRKEGKRVGDILISKGVIEEKQLIDAMCQQLNLEFIDISKFRVNTSLLPYVPVNIAKTHGCLPVKVEGNRLYVAMVDPLNFRAQEAIKEISKMRVIPMLAFKEALTRQISATYESEGAQDAIKELKEGGDFDNFDDVGTGEEEDETAPTIRLVNSIIERGLSEGASDLHIEPQEVDTIVRVRVDGKLQEVLRYPKNLHAPVISRLKIMGSMNTTEKRIPQDGRAEYYYGGKKYDMRINTLPTILGEKCVIRYLRRDSTALSRRGIGIAEADNKRFDRIVKNSSGLILVVGPTGSGKTSTLYTILAELNKPDVNIISLEDPVEFQVAGISQVAINDKVGMTFASALRACLRQDPDIICVGEIRDGETAEIAMRSAMTGHLVLSTLHTEDAVSAIDRLKDMGVEPFLISSSLRGVISQRLVRRICPECKQEVEPDPYECDLIGLKDLKGKHFYKGAGCQKCFQSGYKGRIGVFELLTMNSEIRNAIVSNKTSTELREVLKGSDYTPMLENAKILIENGTTTVTEVLSKIAAVE